MTILDGFFEESKHPSTRKVANSLYVDQLTNELARAQIRACVFWRVCLHLRELPLLVREKR